MILRIPKLFFLLACCLVVALGCNQTKYIPEGKYLVKANKLHVSGDKEIDEYGLEEIIKQKPNFKTLGLKIKLSAFNAIDSVKVANKRLAKNEKIKRKNSKLRKKENRINEKRIEKARRKNREYYTRKKVALKDTVSPRYFFKEWLKYKFGEPPVVLDTHQFNKTIEQHDAFLKRKGYYYGKTSGYIKYKRNGKAVPHYVIETGPRYMIDSIKLRGDNESVIGTYELGLKKGKYERLEGKPFDSDYLDDYRYTVAKNLRDNAIFGFSPNHIKYVADTNASSMKVNLEIEFLNRLVQVEDRDTLVEVLHAVKRVKNAYYHIIDSSMYEGNFRKYLEDQGKPLLTNNFLTTVDTLVFKEVYYNRSEKKNRGIDPGVDSLNVSRIGIFFYNMEPFVDPGIIELQNYLEKENYYKEYYLERSYTRLLQLGLFSTVKPIVTEIDGTNYVDVHYYLVPLKRQGFFFEPRATNSNGFLGVSTSLNYTNRNLFRKSEHLTFAISGGFESQPPIFDLSVDGTKIPKAGRSFNTFEFGPSLKLDMPGLLPFKKAKLLAKRQQARTVFSAALNYQSRTDFKRDVIQFNYLYKFNSSDNQVFQLGFPLVSVIKIVDISKSVQFDSTLQALNDPFLINSYSDQFVWQDWKITFELNTTESNAKKIKKEGRFVDDANFYYTASIDPAGNFLSLFKNYQDTNSFGQREIFGLSYSQFIRMDNELIYAQPLGKNHGVYFRFLAGGGLPYGNSQTSLPYDYSFFGGGANDNRGWRARALGPGAYKYYLDENRTATQIGDLRLGGSVEYRFGMTDLLKGAVFVDMGNIWTINEDPNRPGSQISGQFLNQIAYSTGFGLRADLDFFIVRLDLGWPLSNPALPKGSQWIFQSRENFLNELASYPDLDLSKVPLPFTPVFHLGIGYPF